VGTVDPSLRIEGITLDLKPTAPQRADLQHLLAAQQDPASPDFHRWLTPEQFADRFGLSNAAIAQVSTWLRARGFQVQGAGRARTWIHFSGTAGQLETAFGLHMHRYRIAGQLHFGNANAPAIPDEVSEFAAGFHGLNNFPVMRPVTAFYNSPSGSHFLVPDDIATIYNFGSAVKSGIGGAGVTIGIVGGSDLNLSDVAAFRSTYNLPANTPQTILAGADPGTLSEAMIEGDIDLEWSGAVAPNATLLYVYAANIYNAEQYIVDNNAAQILNSSYGACELQGQPDDNIIAQQAAAQGITWVASSGDTGAAFCDSGASASNGLAVAEPASFPEVTGVGGTTLNEGSGTYWSATNGPNLGSALAYIPETAWNDTSLTGTLTATGGGASVLFGKPLWQNAPGVPADGARDVPDVAFAASPNHDGYEVYTGGNFKIYGGTSVSTPVFAGMVALLNQSLVSRGILARPGLGNINPTLYQLARTTTGVFNDVTQGNNIVPCQAMSLNCNNGSMGFFAGPGYDQATGLGSINVANLLAQWTIPGAVPSNVTVSASPDPDYGSTVTVKLSETAGGGTTLTGFTVNGQDVSSQIPSYFGTATIEPYDFIEAGIGFNNLHPPLTIPFTFAGKDPSGRTWTQQISVPFLAALPSTATAIAGVSNGASFKPVVAPGMILSVFGTNFSASAVSASSLPLPNSLGGVSATVNGVGAPLYYVSAGQVNLQVPYGTAAGAATVTITSASGSATFPFTVQPNAPGIFVSAGELVPYSTGKAGQTLLAFITGEGAVSPAIATGATPSPTTPYTQLPAPVATVAVTVGGVNAPVAFAGIPSGLAGATQINFVVPAGVPTGPQPVIVTIGGIASPAAILTVTQ
jgi:uncharacterized protein (TIGR03437 family)